MVTVWVEVDAEQSLETIGRIRQSMSDLRPLFEQALEPDFYRMEAQRFDSEGGSQKWQPLSPKYAALKQEFYPGRRILELTGDLRKSLTQAGAAGQVRRTSSTEMELGTNLKHAATHHYGSTARMWIPAPFYMWINGVPRREVIAFTAEDERRWQGLAEDYYRRVVGSAA